MTSTVQTPLEVLQNVAARIETVNSEISVLQGNAAQHRHDLAVIEAKRKQRDESLQYLASEDARMFDEAKQARIACQLHQISHDELDAIELPYAEASKKYQKKIASNERENHKDSETVEFIQIQLTDLEHKLSVKQEVLQRLQAAQQQAHQDHGQATYQALHFASQHTQEQRASHVDAIASLDKSQADILNESDISLADFPELRQRLYNDYAPVYRDQVTDMLEALIHCHQQLERVGDLMHFIQHVVPGIDGRWFNTGLLDETPLSMRAERTERIIQFLESYREEHGK